MNAAAAPVAAAEIRGGSATPADALSAAGVSGSTMAEVHAVVALLAMMGLSDAERRPWQILTALVPWYAIASHQLVDAIWAQPVSQVLGGMREHLPALVSQERFTAVSGELARLVPQLQLMLRRH